MLGTEGLNDIILDIRKCLKILFLFDPSLPEHQGDVAWFSENIKQTMGDFSAMFASTDPNYLHELSTEAIRIFACHCTLLSPQQPTISDN